MSKAIQSGLYMEYFNEKPKIKNNISNVSPVVKCWYDPKLPKVKTVEEIKKRPAKYTFNVSESIPKATSCYLHRYFYDNLSDAEAERKEIMLRYYDQLNAPFLKKLNSKARLSIQDQKKLLDIQEMFKG